MWTHNLFAHVSKESSIMKSTCSHHANNKGHLKLVSDTSGVACGAALYQEQRDKLRLVGQLKEITPSSNFICN